MNPGCVRYSVVIPVYGSGDWLADLVERIQTVMVPLGYPFEVILVNDASPDAVTWPTVAGLARKHAWVRGIDLLYNTGQFRAILCGFSAAAGDFVLTMDDDLQHPPEEIPRLIEAIEHHPEIDCVMGLYAKKCHGLLRNAGSRFMAEIMRRLYDKPAGVQTTSFRIMRRELAHSLTLYRIAHPQLGPLILRMTPRVMNVTVRHMPRPSGRSGYRFGRMSAEVLRSVINASIFPLRVVSWIGLSSSGVAFCTAAYFVVRKLMGGIGVPGFTSTVLAITFFSGLILLSIGVLGEYVGRIIQELTGMPRYVIRERVGGNGE